MDKSMNTNKMVGAFPIDKYDRNEIENKTSDELLEMVRTDKECRIYNVPNFIDGLNNEYVDTENFWFQIIG